MLGVFLIRFGQRSSVIGEQELCDLFAPALFRIVNSEREEVKRLRFIAARFLRLLLIYYAEVLFYHLILLFLI